MALPLFPARWLPDPYRLLGDRANDTVKIDHLGKGIRPYTLPSIKGLPV